MSDPSYGFPIFERVAARAERMDEMLRHARLPPVELIRRDAGRSWYEARTRCLECSLDRACRAWLAEHATDDTSVPCFCPNARAFTNMQ